MQQPIASFEDFGIYKNLADSEIPKLLIRHKRMEDLRPNLRVQSEQWSDLEIDALISS